MTDSVARLRDAGLVIEGPERQRIADEIERLRAALRWCSASADFAPDGQFRKDWEKIVAPLVNLYN